MNASNSPRITITLGDDNGTAAPVYRMYSSQYNPQPAYLEFDPGSEGLALEAGYSGEIGNSLPARIWNQAEIWFTILPTTSRQAIKALADDEDLAKLLEIVKAGYEYDPYGPKGIYTEEAQIAMEAIDRHLTSLDQAEVWDASDWVAEGVYVSDAAKHETIELYAAEFEDDEPNRVIEGDLAEAVAKHLAGLVERARNSDQEARKVAAMLATYSPDEYSYLPESFED